MNINEPSSRPRTAVPARAEQNGLGPLLNGLLLPDAPAAENLSGSTSAHDGVTGGAVARRLYAALPPTVEGRLPLHEAILQGDHRAVAALLQAGGEVNQTNADGATPLMQAVVSGDLEILSMLLAHDVIDLDARNGRGDTALHLAVSQGDLATLTLLAQACGVDLDMNATARRNMTPLHLAAQAGDSDKVAVLVSTGAVQPNLRNLDGKTALQLAAAGGHASVVAVLQAVPGIDLDCPSVKDDGLLVPADGSRDAARATRVSPDDFAGVVLPRHLAVRLAPIEVRRTGVRDAGAAS